MQKKKTHSVLICFLWIGFIAAVALVMYLSFQNGEDAAAYGKKLIQYAAEKQDSERSISEEEMNALLYEIRQSGRVIAFFFIGILGTLTIHLSLKKSNWALRMVITALILFVIAYSTEKLKIYIPTRHYSHEEMMFSMAAAAVGFLLVSAVILCFHILKNFFRMIRAAIY